ncbi:hypothetical protein [Sandaracinus amylolyticus]|uniref:hypothetical protein n=1 Tax=Sandaracinus amylolyticus TaxID=927083 RepID=UPI001F29BAF9|nr:hypothetical protein [Sandaracinus amylolyticus]UJR81354.1 Hypothetical protein I5071_34110 [Sandaracinus amylolyticus]
MGPGVLAGLFAATVMGLILMTGSAMLGRGFWTPVQLIGATLLRDRWSEMPALAGFVGVVLHLAVGVAWGVVFTGLTRRVHGRSNLAMLGILFSAFVFLVMTYGVAPWASPWFFASYHVGRYFIVHLVFGLVLGLSLPSAEHVIASRRAHLHRHGPVMRRSPFRRRPA